MKWRGPEHSQKGSQERQAPIEESPLEICRYCEGINPVGCPECEGETMIRYRKPSGAPSP